LVGAADGTVAQAPAAARCVAVVSGNPDYDLVPLPVELPGQGLLSIRLVSVWGCRHTATPTLEAVARRLSTFSCQWYGVAPA
jgi:hypothetical protein